MIFKPLLMAGLMSSALVLTACGGEEEPAKLETLDQKVNYIVAYNFVENIEQAGMPLEPEAFSQAIKDKHQGLPSRLSEEEMNSVMAEFQEQQMAQQQAETEKQAEANQAEAEAFFAENAKKEGVKTTESGLQYKVIEQGEGASPAQDERVTVHYRGRLLDGTEFDSSYERDQPATFNLNSVIAGWTEALQLMSEGGKWELYIPADLAYGPGGNGPIPPNAALIFEVELLKVGEENSEAETETETEAE